MNRACYRRFSCVWFVQESQVNPRFTLYTIPITPNFLPKPYTLMEHQFKYFAFISYSSHDTAWGKKLPRKLESYQGNWY